MAPKPEQARLAFVFGTVLAMAMIVAAMTTWAALPSPSAESIQSTGAIYQSQYLNLY